MKNPHRFNSKRLCCALAFSLLCCYQALSQTAVQAWAQRYSAPFDTIDVAQKVVVDPFGSVIVSGTSSGGASANDWLIIKYSGNGVPIWTNRYDGMAHSDDFPYALALDGSGNVFVTGSSASTNQWPNNYDCVTIKFSSAGIPLWTNRYDGPTQNNDVPSALVVDGNGDVFVTGNSQGTNSSSDYLTIKYSAAGVPLWTKRYNGGGDEYDTAAAMVLDGQGDVFVTGNSQRTNGAAAFVTIKYSGAGAALWTNLYDNLGNSFGLAPFLAADASGTVFLAGFLDYNDGVNADFATIAYASGGSPLWTNYYNGPGTSYDFPEAIAVDNSGNIIVTGSSYDGDTFATSDFTTIKYSGAGAPLWTNLYHGPVESSDTANAVVVDADGNVFVTGGSGGSSGGTTNSDYATVKYSSGGVPLWTNRYDGPVNGQDYAYALGVDGGGNVFVAGGSDSSFATIKYSSGGEPLWTNRFNDGLGNNIDQATALAADSSGNLFVTGYSSGNGSGYDYATIKYSRAGIPLWTNRYNGPGNNKDIPLAIAVDNAGNAIVTGYSASSNQEPMNLDYATIKYSAAGLPMWTNRYSGPGNFEDDANAIAVDPNGNVFVTGASARASGSFGINDYATIKYSSAGVPQWTNRYSGPAHNDNFAFAAAADSAGNVFVTGASASNFGTNYDIITIKYSGVGLGLWTNRYDGPGNASNNRNDYGVAAAVDSSGNVFIAGLSAGGNLGYDYATVKYSSAGALLWVNRYNGPGDNNDEAFSLAVDSGGNVVVTGESVNADLNYDYATIKYSSSGVPIWTNRYDGPGHGEDLACGVAVDAGGTVYVTGYSTGIGSGKDYATIAYSSAGTALWTNRYNGPGNGDDIPGDNQYFHLYLESRQLLALDPAGGVFVTGGSDAGTSGTAFDFLTVKYVVPPKLNIKPVTPTTAQVYWPSPSTSYDLQVNYNLITTNWTTPGETIQDNGTTRYIIVNTTTTNHFYRLKSP